MRGESSRRLKIAVLSRGFFSRAGGAENYSISLVETLAARHEVHVFTQHLDHHYPGVTYHLLPQCVKKPSWVDLLCFSVRSWLATRRGFDLVHSHENTWHGQIQTVHVRPVKVGLFYGKEGLRRYVRYLQIATSPRLWTYLLMEAIRFNHIPGKAVIACSESLRVELERAYPSLRGQVFLLPPGVQFPELSSDEEKSALRNELKLSRDAFVLLFVANDYAKKGLTPLLQALQRLPPNVVLLVVGNSAHIPVYSQLAEQLNVAQQVRFIGSAGSVDRYYRVADAQVHPTTEDSFSMVTLEALAHGLPVVVSGPAYCGISASLTDQVEVLMLRDPRDANEIAKCVQRLFDDGALRLRLGTAGRRFAAKFGWDELAQQQEKIYRLALEAKR
jgi:glycosyltransferase involved in cell wall biosynthesis